MKTNPLISVRKVVKEFDISGGFLDQISLTSKGFARKRTIVHAVTSISFEIEEGETLSVVGESGCGKSTLARTIIGLYRPNSGEIFYGNTRIDTLSEKQMLPFRKKMQMIFQDPYASLNPRMQVKQILEEPIYFHNRGIKKGEVKDIVANVMEQVGINPAWAYRYPHEFSGGQRQRISIARALIVNPEFIVADEPISALDVSIQAQILNLMLDMQEQRKLTYLFISHDLSVVQHISSRVAVMYLGTLCELATSEILFSTPQHPYTKALLSAVPRIGRKRDKHVKLTGEVPSPINILPGCVFKGQCPHVASRCQQEIPQAMLTSCGSLVACHGIEEGWI